MINELEKKFFDTFGIVPKLDCKRCGAVEFVLGQCAELIVHGARRIANKNDR